MTFSPLQQNFWLFGFFLTLVAIASVTISSNIRLKRQNGLNGRTADCGIMHCCRQIIPCVPSDCGLDAQTCAVLEFNKLVQSLGLLKPNATLPNVVIKPTVTSNTIGATLRNVPNSLIAQVLYTSGTAAPRFAELTSAYGTMLFDKSTTIFVSDVASSLRNLHTYVLQQQQPTPYEITFLHRANMIDLARQLTCSGTLTVAALATAVEALANGTLSKVLKTVAQVISRRDSVPRVNCSSSAASPRNAVLTGGIPALLPATKLSAGLNNSYASTVTVTSTVTMTASVTSSSTTTKTSSSTVFLTKAGNRLAKFTIDPTTTATAIASVATATTTIPPSSTTQSLVTSTVSVTTEHAEDDDDEESYTVGT